MLLPTVRPDHTKEDLIEAESARDEAREVIQRIRPARDQQDVARQIEEPRDLITPRPRVGSLPPQLAALSRLYLNVCKLTVRAALEERRDLVYQAALLDPNTAATLSIDEIIRVCDELIDAHGELIPAGIRGG